MSDAKTGRASDQFPLRLPDGMRDRIRAAAEANSRSMNAEIVATLLEKYPPPADPDLEALIERAMKVAPGELTRFIEALIDEKIASGEISQQDISDGLVPGVRLQRDFKLDE